MTNATDTQTGKSDGTGSLVLGVLSLLIPYIGLVLGIFAVITASKSDATGLALAGKITGIIGLVVNLILVIFLATGLFIIF